MRLNLIEKFHQILIVAFAFILFTTGSLSAQSQDRIFWFRENYLMSGTHGIGRMDLDGSNNTTVLSGGGLSNGAIGGVIDFSALKIYWTDRSGNIKRSNLDGTSVETLVTGLSLPWQIALDIPHSKMYWGELLGNVVKRANLDGTSIETIYSGSSGAPGVALDLTHNKLFVALSDDNAIMRMNLDGTSQETIISTSISYPLYLGLDVVGNKIYIVDYYNNLIRRANLDGSSFASVASISGINGITLDLINNKLYANQASGTITKMNLDGTSQSTVSSAPGSYLRSLALDIDRDSDGVQNSLDGCPTDPNKISAGVCGCGALETDTDGDLTPDCTDSCPSDAAKTAAGVCGCGVADTDTDGDATPNCNDACPSDAGKTAAGICGCGVADTDSDTDGTADCNDSCSIDPAKTVAGTCGCGVSDADTDSDGTLDCNESCPNDPAKTTAGFCGCGNSEADANANSIPDCLPEEALQVKSKALQTLVGKTGAKFNIKKTNQALKDLKTLTNSYPAEGVTFTKTELVSRYNVVAKKVNDLIKAVNADLPQAKKRNAAKTVIGQLMNDLIPD